jgi:hypothetical protein
VKRRPALYGKGSATVAAPGTVRLVVKPVKRARAALRRGRTLHVKISVTFRSARGGEPRTMVTKLKVRGRAKMG